MYVVYVLEQNGKPLMPTKRFGHVRRMLKAGQAKAISTKPFVIQLQYKSTDFVQPLYSPTGHTIVRLARKTEIFLHENAK